MGLWIETKNNKKNNENYIDGEHNNGVYNSYNLYPYGYCYQNPIRLKDPNGKQVDAIDFIPVVGSARDIRNGYKEGSIITCGIGIVGLITDVGTFGSGSVIKGGVKAGVKALLKVGTKTVVKAETKKCYKESWNTNCKKSK